MTFLLRMELVHDRQPKRAAGQIGQAIGTEYPISVCESLLLHLPVLLQGGLQVLLKEMPSCCDYVCRSGRDSCLQCRS